MCGRFVSNRDKKEKSSINISFLGKRNPIIDVSLSCRNNAIAFIRSQRCCEKAVIKLPSL